jgi:hypothetical protein
MKLTKPIPRIKKMNVVSIKTMRGYEIRVPVWRIGGLVAKQGGGEYYIAIIGEPESYQVEQHEFDQVQTQWLSWTESLNINTVTAIKIAEEVGKELATVIKNVDSAVVDLVTHANTSISRTVDEFNRTANQQTVLVSNSKESHKEIVECIRDATAATKTVIDTAKNVLSTSDAAVQTVKLVSKKLETLSEDLKKIESLELFSDN